MTDNYSKHFSMNPDNKIKTYKYRLRLDVYEDAYEPISELEPIQKFAIDTLSITDNKNVINEILKLNFEKLLELFNKKHF